MALHRIGDTPLPEPMMTKLYDAIWRHYALMSYIFLGDGASMDMIKLLIHALNGRYFAGLRYLAWFNFILTQMHMYENEKVPMSPNS